MPKASEEIPIAQVRLLESILFTSGPLTIPPYQRPYKWSAKSVNQLIDDILLHHDKSAYRIGTVVTHRNCRAENNVELEVVDGQQRLYTLNLIAAELLRVDADREEIYGKVKNLCLVKSIITHPVSLENLKRNHLLIKERIKEFGEQDIMFFFKKCELVYVELNDISEAFQFFDSQNTRGKDLDPHDLLKAFHLREMESNTQDERINCENPWQEVSEELSNFFTNYLFRLRRWPKSKSGLDFSKKDINTFKGITIDPTAEAFNYINSHRITHMFVDSYNNYARFNNQGQKMDYPFQVDQVMLNGKRFFEYVYHYANLIRQIESLYHQKGEPEENLLYEEVKRGRPEAKKILDILRIYPKRTRPGDRYVRNLFDCCLFYYWDKFGLHKIDEAIIRFFTWAYKLRLEQKRVENVSADKLAREHSGYIRLIREAVHPNEIIRRPLIPAEDKGKDAVGNIEQLTECFRSLKAIKENK